MAKPRACPKVLSHPLLCHQQGSISLLVMHVLKQSTAESTRVLHRSDGGGTCINGTLANWMWHVGLLGIVE